MKKFLIVCSLSVGFLGFATDGANVKVKGMVCSFCAQGIKKKFSGESAIQSVDVNLDDKWVKLNFKDGQSLNDDKIKSLITDAGYNVESIERTSDRKAAAVETKK